MSFPWARRAPRLRRRASFLVVCIVCAALLVACAPAPAPAPAPSPASAPQGAALPDPVASPERPAPTPASAPAPAGAPEGTAAPELVAASPDPVASPEGPAAATPVPVAISPATGDAPVTGATDSDAEEVHHRWVLAMLSGNEAEALAIAAEPDPERRAEHVRKQVSVTASWLQFSNLVSLFGPYLNRFETLGVVPGANEQERIGLSEVLFSRSSACFVTRLVRVAGAWRVVAWEPGVKLCDEYIDQHLPGPLPTEAALAEAEDTLAEWVAAMFGGDPARAETFLIADDAERRQSMFSTLVFLTDYVVKAKESSHGAFRRYELIPTFEESLRRRAGYARVVYEHGQACFRADLYYLDGRWRVKKWDHVIAEACD